MPTKEFLNDFLSSAIEQLEHVRSNGAKRELQFTINCDELEDYNNVDIRDAEKYKDMFDQLKNASGPSVYWFEIISGPGSDRIIEALRAYKATVNPKATPALRATMRSGSNILYVGKIKNTSWGRLIQHLGFYKVNATQGLQLFYWAKGLSLTVKFHVIEFENNMADLLPVIEYAFAKKLQPIIGKHK